jgi:glycosyltransferase involved in cell wall biosynthesis
MAVKDGETYLRTAMDSILGQTFSDFEFIIINDGSKDTTVDVINEYSDSRITLLSNQNSVGLSKSLNLGLEKACGTYIARMDADDISLPHRLELQVSYLDAHPDIAVLGTGFSFIDTNSNILQNFQFPLSHELITWCLPFYNPIVHPSVMMKISLIKALKAYNSDLRRSQDYDLWWRVSFSSKLANLEDVLILVRKHQSQVSRQHGLDQLEHGIEINAKYLSRVMRQRVPNTLVRKMWSGDAVSIKDAIAIGNLIWKWYRINITKVQSATAKSFMMDDTWNKINLLIAPFSGNFRVFPLIVKLYLLGYARKCTL